MKQIHTMLFKCTHGDNLTKACEPLWHDEHTWIGTTLVTFPELQAMKKV